MKGNRETRASCLVIIVIVGYCVPSSGIQKASSARPDNANRNSPSTKASINRVSENKDGDKTITGIKLVPSDLHVLNMGEILLKIKFSIVYFTLSESN